MKPFKIFLAMLFVVSGQLYAQHKKAYTIFTAEGKKSSFSKMLKKAMENEVVFFGELHNNPIAHWLELELAQAVASKKPLIIGAEMFETDQQNELNVFLGDTLNQINLANTISLWSNYKTDYQPLVDFAKNNSIPVIATNTPQIYATMAYKRGLASLDSLVMEEKKYLAPLPIKFDSELPQYKKILSMMGGHGTLELVQAQALKDATMAFFISKNANDKGLFLHLNGAYHSSFHEGILWYVKQYNPALHMMTIAVTEQQSINELENEHLNSADFIICVPSTMTKTY